VSEHEYQPEGPRDLDPDEARDLESLDSRIIKQHIDAAIRECRPIDDATARMIAANIHGGQRSALYAFTSTGIVDRISLNHELMTQYHYDHTDGDLVIWHMALDQYIAARVHEGPVEGWGRLWHDEDENTPPMEPRLREELLAELIDQFKYVTDDELKRRILANEDDAEAEKAEFTRRCDERGETWGYGMWETGEEIWIKPKDSSEGDGDE
jgi:hypothetical protein